MFSVRGKVSIYYCVGFFKRESNKRHLTVEESCILCSGFHHLQSLNVVTTIHFLYRGWRQLLNHKTPLSLGSYTWPFRTIMILFQPLQAPQQYVDEYKFIKNDLRRTYAGMVDIVDEAINNRTEAFKTVGYVETCIVKFKALN